MASASLTRAAGEAFGRGFGLDAFGDANLRLRHAVGGFEIGVGQGDALDGFVLRGLLLSFGGLDVLDELFLGLGLGGDDRRFLVALRFFDDLKLFDALLLLDDGALDGDTLADDFLDLFALDFESFLFVDTQELDLTFAVHRFELAVFRDALGLDTDDALAVFPSNLDLSVLVLFRDHDFFVGLDAGSLGFPPLFRLDLHQ